MFNEKYANILIFLSGDWHTAYLLLYGPRKLPKFSPEKKSEEKSGDADKMETA
jgi:hypothetical protein